MVTSTDNKLGEENNSNKNVTTFEHIEMDVSIDRCCWIACLPFTCGATPYSTILLLDDEEVTKTDKNLCGTSVSKRPYGELGSVDRTSFLCLVELTSSFGPISPGCGCDRAKVDEAINELKQRMRGRGDTAQIQRAEQTLDRLDEIEKKIDLILKKLDTNLQAQPMVPEQSRPMEERE